MSHIVKATRLKPFAKFHNDRPKQSVLNATSPNYANYEVTHALTRLNSKEMLLKFLNPRINSIVIVC